MRTLQDLLKTFLTESASKVEQGKRFEKLVHNYLLSSPIYQPDVKKVWLWSDFYAKGDFGTGGDVGIDLVVETHFGEYWAIQAKFFTNDTQVYKADVDTFLSTSGRSFYGPDMSARLHFTQRYFFVTNGMLTENARQAFGNTSPPARIVTATDMAQDDLDWDKLAKGEHGRKVRLASKLPRPHQKMALAAAIEHFDTSDRGRLIMACGTGKTYTSLLIAEQMTSPAGSVLFLVPSIALLGQSLREWSNDAKRPIRAICICSDAKVVDVAGKKVIADDEDRDSTMVSELAFPASTNVRMVVQQFRRQAGLETYGGNWLSEPTVDYTTGQPTEPMLVVFSTYQSIDVIAKAQAELLAQGVKQAHFDLIICDEAHRTTGVTLAGTDESAFVRVHDNSILKAKKRIYMTATPKIYGDESQTKAKDADATLASMDDLDLYGLEFYRIGFGLAVEQGLLTDYKVLVLTISENQIPLALQRSLTDDESEIKVDDASSLIGCINALSKQLIDQAEEHFSADDTKPMRRAVAFSQNIKLSKHFTSVLNANSDRYRDLVPEARRQNMVKMKVKHIDGSMSALERNGLLDWLKDEPDNDLECRMLNNVRCLSEGVDVPSLDAVIFLSGRNSPVDVVQSVGRVMRLSAGKKYGYIIIPVFVPTTIDPALALDKNKRFKVVWDVLNALRAHDDRFNATINHIELNKKRPSQIKVTTVPNDVPSSDGNSQGADPAAGGNKVGGSTGYQDTGQLDTVAAKLAQQMSLGFGELQEAIFARIVQKVGDRMYWDNWATDIARIAEDQVAIISKLVKAGVQAEAFGQFMVGLHQNINPSITQQEAIEMLAQHRITKPVFDALFDDYSFATNNPISVAMEDMLVLLDAHGSAQDMDILSKFYDSVRKRASGIDNAEGKQRIIIELYDKFFQKAFPAMAQRLGIVYTPVEVVDFIIKSVDVVLKETFGRGLAGEDVHVLDPFTGTGTFMTRLIQSGLIPQEDLVRKYKHELHANEIVLLAYYIAAVNIENAFHDAVQAEEYLGFDGICLTDTFQLGEKAADSVFIKEMFPANTERVKRQKAAPLRVIIGNPPYSVGQTSANDNAQNQSYPGLERRIADTYAKLTNASNKNSLYDSYIKAFRWSSDRLDQGGGVIAFVTNGAWLDSRSANGLRRSLVAEFSAIYVFNLRGNARTSGEQRRREKDNVFGQGSRTPIAITLLVKHPNHVGEATIKYADIGDYLSRNEKLSILTTAADISSDTLSWQTITPDAKGDWINLTEGEFDSWIPLEPTDKFKLDNKSIFIANSNGVKTNRDAWVYGFSKEKVFLLESKLIFFYNNELERFISTKNKVKIENFVGHNPTEVSWSSGLFSKFSQKRKLIISGTTTISLYRPFNKTNLTSNKNLLDRPAIFSIFFPTPESENLVICVPGIGVTKEFSCIITNQVPDLELIGKSQCFPLYYYEEIPDTNQGNLFSKPSEKRYHKRSAIAPFILKECRARYGREVSAEQVFYFVYGFLHDPTYCTTYANDLKKSLPRISLPNTYVTFAAVSSLGEQLAQLHLNYETQPKPAEVIVRIEEVVDAFGGQSVNFMVNKMRYVSKADRTTIHYNDLICIQNIPPAVFEYVVNGKPAIDWILERYQITTHKESGIQNNPNDWADEVGNPRYILDLLLSVMTVSLRTVELVQEVKKLLLPPNQFNELDAVRTTEAIGEVPVGTIGAIVFVYDGHKGYEVEFVIGDKPHLLTVTPTQIAKP